MTAPGLPHDALHAFPARIIGKHEWCMVIQPSRWQPGARVLEYYWRPLPVLGHAYNWRHAEQWPSYNHNDGCYGGMPRTLRTYWESYADKARHWLSHGRAPGPSDLPQMELFV